MDIRFVNSLVGDRASHSYIFGSETTCRGLACQARSVVSCSNKYNHIDLVTKVCKVKMNYLMGS